MRSHVLKSNGHTRRHRATEYSVGATPVRADAHAGWFAAVLLAATALAGCDGGGDDPPPTFTELRERVFTPSCTFLACHSGASPAGGLGLDTDTAHTALVDAMAMGVPGRIRVVAGDPDGSYLIEKLTATMPAAGDPMPPTAPLEAGRIELVRAWIEAGAADD